MRIIVMAFIGVSLMLSCQINGKPTLSANNKRLDTDSLKCKIELVVQLSKTIENPDKVNILNFLYTFDEICNLNVEYREFSNEILFQVAQKHPDQVLDLLSSNDVKIHLILNELRHPISDDYNEEDVRELIEKIKNMEDKKK